MVGGATEVVGGTDFAKANLNSPKADGSAYGGSAVATAAYSRESDSLYMKYTSRDGDVLEVSVEHSEESFTYAGVRAGAGPAHDRCGNADAASAEKGGGAAATAPADGDADAVARLKKLHDWAAKVEDEARKQQKRILEESLKRSGKFMPGGNGRYIVIYAGPEDAQTQQDKGESDSLVPEYWNAENTSDRIVNFATQMAQIAGEDSDFAKTIMQAVKDGFDQAGAATGPLPGAAGELNRKTRDLTFSKLSKWLEEHKSKGYNQGTQSEAISTLDVPDGIENNEQRQDSALYSEGENRLG